MAKSALKFKDTVEAFDRLSADISARRFAPVYLLMGEEGYFIDRLCEQLSEGILDETERAFNQITLYGKDSDAGTVINCCRQMPMSGRYEVIIVKEAQQMRDVEKLSVYTSKPSPTTILVICHKEKSTDRRSAFYKSAFYKSIAEHGVVFESVRPRDYEVGAWLTSLVAGKGCSIDRKALAMLTDHLGTDLAKISNEIDKLLVSLPEGVKQITDTDIEQNIGISKDFNCYELCRAVVTQDMPRAMDIASHLSRNPKANPMPVILAALFGQFRDIFTVNYLRWQSRVQKTPFPSDGELMRFVKVGNPYFLGELKQNAALWNNSKVYNVLGLLREYDAKSKGVDSGGISDGELLRELLLKIFIQ